MNRIDREKCCRQFVRFNRSRYLGREYHFVVRVLWTFFWMAALLLAGYTIYREVTIFTNSSVRSTINRLEINWDRIPFPVIHIHNTNQLRKSFFREVGISPNSGEHSAFNQEFVLGHSKTRLDEDDMRNLMRAKLKLIDKDLLANYSFYSYGSHNCDETVLQSTNAKMPSKRSFTESRIGCLLYDEEESALSMNKIVTLLLDAETFDHDSVLESAGFEVMVSPSLDERPISRHDKVKVSPGFETSIQLSVTDFQTTPEALASIDPLMRGCYYVGEMRLAHFRPWHGFQYSLTNCFYDALLQRILDQCHCLPKFAEFLISTEYANCHGIGLRCANDLVDHIGEPTHNLSSRINGFIQCLPQCNFQAFETKVVTSNNFQDQNSFQESPHFCLLAKKLQRTCLQSERKILLEQAHPAMCSLLNVAKSSGQLCPSHPLDDSEVIKDLQKEIYKYAQKNLVILHYSFSLPYLTIVEFDVEYKTIDFVIKLFTILTVLLGFNVLIVPEWFLQLISAVCIDGRGKVERRDDKTNIIHVSPN